MVEEERMVEDLKEGKMEEMLVMNTGFPLLIQQFKALVKKNLIIAYRNKISTLLQLFSSLFFIALLLIIDKSLNFNNTIYDPEADVFPPIPPCEEKYFIKRDSCFDFVWSGKKSNRLLSIVDSIMVNNPGRPIPPAKVKYFETSIEVDAWFFEAPRLSPGALHFVERNATVIGYGIQTNSTDARRRGHSEDPTFKFQIPLQIAAERAIARSLLEGPNFSWQLGLMKFPYPDISIFNTMRMAGPPFFLAFTMFRFVSQISSLVTERELKLRQAMSTMGLFETAYWLSWFTWEAFMTLLSSVFLVLFGILSKFDFFIHNNFMLVFLVFFLFQINMIGFAFFLSTLLSKSSSAGTTGFTVFILSILALPITTFGFPYVPGFSLKYRIIWSMFPPNLFSHAISLLLSATQSPGDEGFSWSKRANCGPDAPGSCTLAIAGVYKCLVSTFFVWILLTLYFDNVLPNSSGLRKPLFYFLNPGYWTGKGGSNGEEGGLFGWTSLTPPPENVIPSDEDVQEEENIVKQQMNESANDSNIAVQIRGLVKTYCGTITGGCCKFKRTKPFHAVKGLWMNLEKDQLFCLLGPNGAGKTTAISCLTGIVPVTSGDALIYGHSVRSSVGMSNIRKLMGVCPQFDILWDGLSGEEHLHLFAAIKGLPTAEINMVAKKALKEVRLTESSRVRSGSYSGGMKRRLSVAIALIGDPKLVILDEPTTGMDPITRRHVWDVIENAKKGRVIVLTTHSMEEADILSDRIAITAKGKLRCIGTSIRLKSRFGSGFIANVSFEGRTLPVDGDSDAENEPHHEPVKQFFKQHLDIVPKEESIWSLSYVIPHEKEGLLTRFFSELQDREKEFGIIDIQLGLTTLEEVFMNIAKKAELESALLEGNLVTLTLTSGTDLQIPKGSRFVGIPGTESEEHPNGLMVEVYWEQDESGGLCISGHSLETPVPQNLQQGLATAADNLGVKSLEQIGPIKGILLDSVNR